MIEKIFNLPFDVVIIVAITLSSRAYIYIYATVHTHTLAAAAAAAHGNLIKTNNEWLLRGVFILYATTRERELQSLVHDILYYN